MDCDVLLLTEVSERLELGDDAFHATEARMAARRHWSAVLSRHDLEALPDRHVASAMSRHLFRGLDPARTSSRSTSEPPS
jgi:hypothetical protein